MEFANVVKARRSVKKFIKEHSISDAELRQLFQLVALSPSSFNLQHWRFVVVREAEGKAKLQEACFGQTQVGEASAVVAVLGKLPAHEDAATILSSAPSEVQEKVVGMIHKAYADKSQLQRDEAIRSASLAAMTLMYGAIDMGYDTCPMIGFHPKAVTEFLKMDENHIPVMLIVIGKQREAPRPREMRFPLKDLVKLESFGGKGLG